MTQQTLRKNFKKMCFKTHAEQDVKKKLHDIFLNKRTNETFILI